MDESAKKNQDVIRRFAWEIASISVHLEELRHFWAKTLGISGPQWMMIVPSRPREFHPEPLTDPDLILSHHPARAID